MACDITKGKITLPCKNSVSGLRNIYLANFGDYGMTASGPMSGTSSVPFEITDLGNLSEVFQYRLKNSGNVFDQGFEGNVDNGTWIYNPVLTVVLTKISKEMELQVYLMGTGHPLIFVETMAGDIFLVGRDNGMELSGSSGVGGTMDSLNGSTLTFTGQERYPIHWLDSSSVSALKQLISANNF